MTSSSGAPGISRSPTSALPLVSILLPVRNGARTLDEAIGSILRQTLPAIEVVVIDDGSTDATPEILARYAAGDGRVRIRRTRPRGIVPALEEARSLARASILARMDADDVAEPDRIEVQWGFLRAHPEIALCGTHVEAFPRARVAGGRRRYEAWLNGMRTGEDVLRDLFVECPLAHPTFVMRAEALDSVGGYRDAGWPEDYDLLLRLWLEGYGLGVVPRRLLRWREGNARLSRTDPRYAPSAFRRLKLHVLSRSLLRERNGIVIWGAGPVGKAMAREAMATGVRVRAFVEVDPGKIGQIIHSAPVVPPEAVSAFPDALILAAVAGPRPRDEIRAALRAVGRIEGKDFVAVA